MPRTQTTFRSGHFVAQETRDRISRVLTNMGSAAGRPNLLEYETGLPNELGKLGLELRKQGLSIRQIGEELNVPKSVVGRLVKKFA